MTQPKNRPDIKTATISNLHPPSVDTSSTVKMDSVEARIDNTLIVGPLSLTVSGGGITAIMGPNGAGKSWFLRLAHGLAAPSAGKITWGGRQVDKARPDQSFVFQQTKLLRRSVWANIEFPLRARGWSRARREARTAEALSRARLIDRADDPAAALSGGEKQRMALARAWVTGPKVMLLDEPSANLDPASTAEIERLLRELSDEGIKILIATHDIGQAKRIADDVLFFADGVLVEQAPTSKFLAAPKSIEATRYLNGEL
ncbi:MAG: ATP-binding cassette domain-containing protein [Pikeienuella sp.]